MANIMAIDSEREKVIDILIDGLNQDGFSSSDVKKLCETYPEWADDLKGIWKLWKEMDVLSAPANSEWMRERFLNTLSEFEQERIEKKPAGKYVHINTVFRWAAIFIIGFGLGIFIDSGFYKENSNETTKGNGSTSILAQLTSLESASDRLIAIQSIKDLSTPANNVLEALYTTLINDPNVNVRLSALEAMLHFIDNPHTRELLVKGLTYQDSPIVQMTLAEVIIKLQQEGSMEELKKLLDANGLELEVKMYLEETLNL